MHCRVLFTTMVSQQNTFNETCKKKNTRINWKPVKSIFLHRLLHFNFNIFNLYTHVTFLYISSSADEVPFIMQFIHKDA